MKVLRADLAIAPLYNMSAPHCASRVGLHLKPSGKADRMPLAFVPHPLQWAF